MINVCVYIKNHKYLDVYIVKPVLNEHLKVDKTNVLMIIGSLNIAKIPIGAFCNIIDLH